MENILPRRDPTSASRLPPSTRGLSPRACLSVASCQSPGSRQGASAGGSAAGGSRRCAWGQRRRHHAAGRREPTTGSSGAHPGHRRPYRFHAQPHLSGDDRPLHRRRRPRQAPWRPFSSFPSSCARSNGMWSFARSVIWRSALAMPINATARASLAGSRSVCAPGPRGTFALWVPASFRLALAATPRGQCNHFVNVQQNHLQAPNYLVILP